jgi:hypothetical protein
LPEQYQLLTAAKDGRVTVMRDLLDEGANIEYKDKVRCTSVEPIPQSLCKSHYWNRFRAFCESSALLIAVRFPFRRLFQHMQDGMTALSKATAYGHADCVHLLLDAGVDKDLKDGRHRTALFWAARNGRADCARLLLEAGADVNATDEALIHAAELGHADCLRLLLDAGADKEVRDHYGCTALFVAAASGQVECVRLMLDAGADQNAIDKVLVRCICQFSLECTVIWR